MLACTESNIAVIVMARWQGPPRGRWPRHVIHGYITATQEDPHGLSISWRVWRTSDTKQGSQMPVRKSDCRIVPMKSGNSDGGKGGLLIIAL